MSISKLFFITFLFIIFSSCDPARTLVVKVADKPNLSVSIFGNKTMLPFANEDETEKVIIRIPSELNSKKLDTTFYYGMGGWKIKGVLPEFVSHIDSIIIRKSTGKVILNNKKEILSYLQAHQTGYLGSLLTIAAE